MLIEKYDLDVYSPPCDPGAERYTARARFTADISEVLPYLNATLRGASYVPEASALTWKKSGHDAAFHAYEIVTGNIENREVAEKEISELVSLVNRTWEGRAEITPSYEVQKRLTHMAIYKLLPLSNCRQCGEPTCYTFAIKLTAAQKKLSDCPPLTEAQYAEKRKALQDMMQDVSGG